MIAVSNPESEELSIRVPGMIYVSIPRSEENRIRKYAVSTVLMAGQLYWALMNRTRRSVRGRDLTTYCY